MSEDHPYYKHNQLGESQILNTISQAFTLNADPSVSFTFPPVGLQRMFLHPSQVMVDWAWLKIVVAWLQPPHLTSMKQELGAGISRLSLCFCFSDSQVGCSRSLSMLKSDQQQQSYKLPSVLILYTVPSIPDNNPRRDHSSALILSNTPSDTKGHQSQNVKQFKDYRHLSLLASLSHSISSSTSFTLTGPFTFLTRTLPWSLPEVRTTLTWVMPPLEPVLPRRAVTLALTGSAYIVVNQLGINQYFNRDRYGFPLLRIIRMFIRGLLRGLAQGSLRVSGRPRYKCNFSTSYANYIMAETEPLVGEVPTKKLKTMTTLDHLKEFSKVVADTANFNEIEKYHPEDSTTNPSLLLQIVSATNDFSQKLIDESIAYANNNFHIHCHGKKRKAKKTKKDQVVEAVQYAKLNSDEQEEYVDLVCDHLSVSFGCELLKRLPGYVSTQIYAALSFDKDATVERARRIIQLYKERGIEKDRVLIKIASTWEGIKAAQVLRKDKINCNMTLIFNKTQAIQCAESRLFLISPFVGRILDWHKKNSKGDFVGANDPGVQSVTEIYNYFKHFKYDTIVMAASFRNIDQILELAGCDRLTISPALLKQLEESNREVTQKLSVQKAVAMTLEEVVLSEKQFRYDMNRDPMATEKLAEGIRKFEDDANELKEIVRKRIGELGKVQGS